MLRFSSLVTNFLYAQVLAVGFLLVILSCALWNKYYPLLVVATYVLAPVPNWVCGRCANPDDFGTDGGGSAVLDFGKFVTGFLVAMGIGQFLSSLYILLLVGVCWEKALQSKWPSELQAAYEVRGENCSC